jgi:hypothetical protein
VLGHASYETTDAAYNLAQALDAARRVHATLGAFRRGAVGSGRSVRPSRGGSMKAAVYARYSSENQRALDRRSGRDLSPIGVRDGCWRRSVRIAR